MEGTRAGRVDTSAYSLIYREQLSTVLGSPFWGHGLTHENCVPWVRYSLNGCGATSTSEGGWEGAAVVMKEVPVPAFLLLLLSEWCGKMADAGVDAGGESLPTYVHDKEETGVPHHVAANYLSADCRGKPRTQS